MKKQAFSLVELMITLIIISCIISALIPMITKKLKSQGITVGSDGNGSVNLDVGTECEAWTNCALCTSEKCVLCKEGICNNDEYINHDNCTCELCNASFGDKCVECNIKQCSKCVNGHYINSENCTICPVGSYCNGADKIVCPEGWYSDIEGATECKEDESIADYKIFTDPTVVDTYTVPDSVSKIRVVLVSGGAGGSSGKIVSKKSNFSETATWTIPAAVRNETIQFSAVGGGGGKYWKNWSDYTSAFSAEATYGYEIVKKDFVMPDRETIKIVVGTAGKNASRDGGGYQEKKYDFGGAEPLMVYSGWAGKETYFSGYHENDDSAYQEYVAKGGKGRGAKGTYTDGTTIKAYGQECAYGTGSITHSEFVSVGKNEKDGYMRIYWNEKTAGAGGGAGQIAYNEEIPVTPGETLTVIVGRGGAGGIVGTVDEEGQEGEWGNEEMVSKIISDYTGILAQSTWDLVNTGATGGSADGTTGGTAGFVTNGQIDTQISIEGFSGENGTASSGNSTDGYVGGAGGRTTISGVYKCSPGAGGTVTNLKGSDALGYGGCGGGGGVGADGGAGAPGYVRIEAIKD